MLRSNYLDEEERIGISPGSASIRPIIKYEKKLCALFKLSILNFSHEHNTRCLKNLLMYANLDQSVVLLSLKQTELGQKNAPGNSIKHSNISN